MKRSVLLIVVLVLSVVGQLANAQVGTWKNYLAYSEIQDVKRGGNMLYVLASNDLYTFNENDQSIQTYDKVNGLSDCGISKIEWNNTVRKLIILYSDYNIDFLDANGNIINLSDYYSSSVTSKDVYDIYMSNQYAYLSTGFGIVKVNMRDNEISDTYNLRFRVDYSYISGDSIYAASSTNGLYRAPLAANLLDPNQWSRVGNYTAKSYSIDPDLLAEAQTLNPGGPRHNHFAFCRYNNNRLYNVSGGFQYTIESHYPGLVQVLDGDHWTFIGDEVDSLSDHLFIDLATVDIDPTDNTHMFTAGRTGLYEFRNDRFVKEYTPANSPPQGAATVSADNKNYTLVFGIRFDSEGNLWVLNSQSDKTSVLELSKSGEWVDHNSEAFHPQNGFSLGMMVNPIFDSDNLLWFGNRYWGTPSVACYQPSTGGANLFDHFINEDGTAISPGQVNSVAEDMNGNIWVSTQVGPVYINAADKTNSPDDMIFQQYKVPRNDGTDLADYLLNGVDITSIAIDGGNRKWFGSNGNGVYLISADNNTEIHHFLTTNSPLVSDYIQSIAINPQSGEVFFGTDNGLCSYMSDATSTVEKMSKDVTYAYPNPVKPDYTGPITITGLTYDADVKIVTTNGVLVAEGRSSGGSFIWDGTDLKGKRVASGVYMVQTATSTGDKGTVCKIAIVN